MFIIQCRLLSLHGIEELEFKENYLQGDDGNGLTVGNTVWTRGTDDKEFSPRFYHRYVDKNMKTFWSNGYGGLRIYVRKL